MKPSKPYPDFPLFYHQTGQWAKKVRGRTHYFGVDPDAALAKWLEDRDALLAGRTPKKHTSGATVRDVANRFLAAKQALVTSGELSPRTWRDYFQTCEALVAVFGRERTVADLDGKDFEKLRAKLTERLEAVALSNTIQRVRSVFKYALDSKLITGTVDFGAGFKKPSRKVIRKAKNAAGEKMVEADTLREIIEAAGVPMRAMVLLALNCGYGQSDVAALPVKALDLVRGWANFPRPKTEIPRRCPLWPETVEAVRAAIEARPDSKTDDFDGLVFLTRFGVPWVRLRDRGDKPATPIDSIQQEFQKLLAALKIERFGFYTLRHVHRTIADGAKDQIAADYIMGHVPYGMASSYRQRIDDDRFEAVTEVVREWLYTVK